MLTISGVNTKTVLSKPNITKLVGQLKTLHINDDEILSDITFTILTCRKDFNPKKSNKFFTYFYSSLENNLRKKIHAIQLRYATECSINELSETLETKKDSPILRAVSECPDLIEFSLGHIEKVDSEYLSKLEEYI